MTDTTELMPEPPRSGEKRRYSVWKNDLHVGYVALFNGKWDAIIPCYSRRRDAIARVLE